MRIGYKLRDLFEMTEEDVRALARAHIRSPDRLLKCCYNVAHRKAVGDITGIPVLRLLKYARCADLLRIRDMGPIYANALTDLGVYTVPGIAYRSPVNVWGMLYRYFSTLPIIHPPIQRVQRWVADARELPKLVIY